MLTYALLANPGHNRVYFEQSRQLSQAELEIACRSMQTVCGSIRQEQIGGVPYILFDAQEELGEQDRGILSRLSFVYAIFLLENREEERLLRPLRRVGQGFVEKSVSSILKYSGKTNELFTRLMINVALFSGDFAGESHTVLLDPVAGKGTTLFEALALGHHALGVELVERAVHDGCVFLKKYLENGKYKHTYHKERRSGQGKAFTAVLHQFELARTKEDFKDPARRRTLTMAVGDTRYTNQLYKRGSVHLLVGDLPYGVAHGNVSGGRQAVAKGRAAPTRNPKELLRECLPAWREVLRSGGTLALAWNSFLISREEMGELLAAAGFDVQQGGPYERFEHRVDQAIRRDLIVARR